MKHFSNAGFPCPIMQSPSDHFLRAINTDFDRIIAMCKNWQVLAYFLAVCLNYYHYSLIPFCYGLWYQTLMTACYYDLILTAVFCCIYDLVVEQSFCGNSVFPLLVYIYAKWY